MEEHAQRCNEAPEVNAFCFIFPTGLIDVKIKRIGDMNPDLLGNWLAGIRDPSGNAAGRAESNVKVEKILNDIGNAPFGHSMFYIEVCNGSMQPGAKT